MKRPHDTGAHLGASPGRTGPFSRWLEDRYQRLGPLYPRFALLIALPGGYVTGALATAGTALYIDMSVGQYARLTLASWLLIWFPETIAAARVGLAAIKPITAWLRGRDNQRDPAVAWAATADLPFVLLRKPVLYAAALPGMILWGLYAKSQLGLPGYSVGVFFAASLLVYIYWVAVRFLGVELNLRPLLDDLGASLPPETKLNAARVPLRWRLLSSLIAISLVTGISVGGFSASGSQDIRGLGFALLGSAVAALVVSSWLIGLLATSITQPLSRLRAAAQRVGGGDFSVRVSVSSTDETGELSRSFNEMASGLEERERIRDAFGTYVDREVAEHILREGTSLAGEEVEVTMLFLDIRNFTGFAERSSAQKVVATVNRLFERVVPIIHAHSGHVDKFVGDGLLAVFGAPRRQEDHADQALAAALAMAAAVDEEFQGELAVGIGLNSGRVVAGNVGGGGRLEFSVIGDPVNVAARVESATRKTGDIVLLSEHTRALLRRDDPALERRPGLPLKGKTETVELYAPATVTPARQPSA